MTTQRGRKSIKSKQIDVESRALTTITKRLPAPATLTKLERAVWIELVSDQPADAFTAAHIPLMEAYCGHVVRGRIMDAEISQFDVKTMKFGDVNFLTLKDGYEMLDRLMKMRERETRAASSLATRMRITRQSIHQLTAARGNRRGGTGGGSKPWENDE